MMADIEKRKDYIIYIIGAICLALFVCGIFAMAFAVTFIASPMEALLGTVAGIIAIVLIIAGCWAVMTLLE